MLVWTAIGMIVFIGFMGLALDTLHAHHAGQQLQVAADASAMAAAIRLRDDLEAARTAAVDLGARNRVANAPLLIDRNEENDPDGDVVIGWYDADTGDFTPTTIAPNAVRVAARRTEDSTSGALGLFFGPAFGVGSVNMTRTATARLGGGAGAGLLVLHETDRRALHIAGNSEVSVAGGVIHVDSSHEEAATAGGQSSELHTQAVHLVGGPDSTFEENFSDLIRRNAPRLGDPLWFLPEPAFDPAQDQGSVRNETRRLSPGYYSGGIRQSSSNVHLELDPGIYVLDGAGLDITGGDFIAHDVLIHVRGEGVVNIRGNGTIEISPLPLDAMSEREWDLFYWNLSEADFPDDDPETYRGVSIFQSRSNANTAYIRGTSTQYLEGTLYFPGNVVDLRGTSGNTGTQLLASKVEFSGNADILLTYDGRYPAMGRHVALVR